MHDLALSIIDGRYQEQKLRLHACALRKRVYLIEGKWSSQDVMPSERLRTAMHFTQAEGFLVQHCETADDSLRFLASVHEQVASMLPGGSAAVDGGGAPGWLPEPRQTYAAFAATAVKNKEATVGSIFGKQLRQVEGMSANKTEALLRDFPVPSRLIEACGENTSAPDCAKMLGSIKWGPDQKNLGPVVGSRIGALVSQDQYT